MEWAEVLSNPFLQNLPFKIELNRFGTILMSPASNRHGRIQGRMAANLVNKLPGGEVITECSIQTAEGVKVADVVWASDEFIRQFTYETPYPKAPELCIEIVSPSNAEISGKVDLYLAKGAQEVWVISEDGTTAVYSHIGTIGRSAIAPGAERV
jgi:Uma2 family endonuclease